MHPYLFTFPGGYSIKTYGFCMMVGFLTGVWLAMRRAMRVKADPDIILDIGFLSLLFGVGGARLFFVTHYWKSQFADAPNQLLAVLDITKGGLEFLGGLIGAVLAATIYAHVKKISLRLYLDILAPSAMWGLAIGRIGCFFNACCFGGPATLDHTHMQAHPWAVRFPYGSSPHLRQWEERDVTLPAELMFAAHEPLVPFPIPDTALSMSLERRERPKREAEQLAQAYERAKAENPDSAQAKSLQAAVAAMAKRLKGQEQELGSLAWAQRFPSRVNPARKTSVSELEELAAGHRSLPIHPTQLYDTIHALILSGLLSALFYVRKRHGVVMGALLLLYPLPRFLLESIRADNPGDVGGFTASQFVSAMILALGVAWMIVLFWRLPERSPYAVAPAPAA